MKATKMEKLEPLQHPHKLTSPNNACILQRGLNAIWVLQSLPIKEREREKAFPSLRPRAIMIHIPKEKIESCFDDAEANFCWKTWNSSKGTHTIVFCRKVNSKGKSGKRLSRSQSLKIRRKSLSNHQSADDSLIEFEFKNKSFHFKLKWDFFINYEHHVISSFFPFFRLF